MGRGSGVRAATPTSIAIDFRYRGVRCRERIKLPPTPRNLRYAESLLGQIRMEIAKGDFDYAHHFPTSPRLRLFAGPAPARSATVGELLQDWLKRKAPELEHSTYVEYERTIRLQLTPRFGPVRADELTRQDVRDWAAAKPGSAKWLNNVLSPLRQALDDAVDDGLLAANPTAGLRVRRKRLATEADDIDPFSPDEVRAIISASADPFRNLVQFGFFTGMRTSELIALRWADVDLEAGTARVRAAFVRGQRKTTKTAAGLRTIDLLPPAIEALKAQRQHTQLAGDVVFANPRTGKAWASGKAARERDWTAALRRAKVPYRYPYQMRHTFASMLLSAGENVMWVARQLGHRDWTITAKRYARWVPEVDRTAGDKAMAAWEREEG